MGVHVMTWARNAMAKAPQKSCSVKPAGNLWMTIPSNPSDCWRHRTKGINMLSSMTSSCNVCIMSCAPCGTIHNGNQCCWENTTVTMWCPSVAICCCCLHQDSHIPWPTVSQVSRSNGSNSAKPGMLESCTLATLSGLVNSDTKWKRISSSPSWGPRFRQCSRRSSTEMQMCDKPPCKPNPREMG